MYFGESVVEVMYKQNILNEMNITKKDINDPEVLKKEIMQLQLFQFYLELHVM